MRFPFSGVKPKMKRHCSALATSLTLLAAGSARAATGQDWGRPVDISLDGHRSDWLFNVTTVSVSILFLIMCGIILWALLKHRAGNHAHYEHGIGRSHLLFTALISSIIFFGVDGTLLYNAFADIHAGFYKYPTSAENPLTIEVMAQQWAWAIRYPGPDGKFNTEDDIVTLNDMHIPVGKPVYVKLRSKDVIHSFYLPNFRVKRDAMPGTTTDLWFQAVETGVVDIGCAQHCGVNHYKMRGTLTVDTPAAYAAWEKAAVADAKLRNDMTDKESQWGWDWENR
jgi:cytochrome c oxidase subunit 2